MKRVQWSSAERVDVPDLSAMSATAQSEFRRTFAAAIIGANGRPSILSGFEVEPEVVPSTRFQIRLDRSADAIPGKPDSFAIGAKDLGGGSLDDGVMFGGRDTAGDLEGPAIAIVDLAAQPVATYFVEIRYNEVDGEQENRAFWNEGANNEFVQATFTRTLPTWEARATPVAFTNDGDWIPLAEVVWDGGTIDPADITDRRTLTHEGPVDNVQYDSQALASAAGLDFDRTLPRGAFGKNIASVYEHLDALSRHVLDLKGPTNDGKFDRFSRPFSAPVRASGDIRTKSLRTIDTVTYTIGDGVTEFGDFDSLQDCWNFIDANDTVMPSRVKIVLKTRNVAGFFHTMTDGRTFDGTFDLEIVGALGTHFIDYQSPNPVGLITLLGTGRTLTLDKVFIISSAGGPLLRLETNHLVMDRSILAGPVGVTENYALRCWSDRLRITDSKIQGLCEIGGTADFTNPLGGVVERTFFDTCRIRLRLQDSTFTLTTLEVAAIRAARLDFKQCQFTGRTMGGGVTPEQFGGIDARGTARISFHGCAFEHSADEDGIRLGTLATTTVGTPTVGFHADEGCQFFMRADATHASGAGVGGAAGTGHHIYSESLAVTSLFEVVNGVRIEDSAFAGALSFQSPDASAIKLVGAKNTYTDGNRLQLWSLALGLNRLIYIKGGAGFGDRGHWIGRNSFGGWLADPGGIICITLEDLEEWSCYDNKMDARLIDDSDATVLMGVAMQIKNCAYGTLDKNKFLRWRHPTLATTLDSGLWLTGTNDYIVFGHNEFIHCGGAAIFTDTLSRTRHCHFDTNVFQFAGLTFRAAIDLDATTGSSLGTASNTYSNNRWDFAGSSHLAIGLGDDIRFSVMGNHFETGDLQHRTLGGAPTALGLGYPAGATLLNIFGTYT